MTYTEIKERLLELDVLDVIEMLQLTSDELVEAFSCKIEDMFPQLEELLDPQPITDVGVQQEPSGFNHDEHTGEQY